MQYHRKLGDKFEKRQVNHVENVGAFPKRLMHQVGGKSFVDMNASSELNEAGRDYERDDCNNGSDYRSYESNSWETLEETGENLSDNSYRVHMERMLKKIWEKIYLLLLILTGTGLMYVLFVIVLLLGWRK